jgi:hypothetical protein
MTPDRIFHALATDEGLPRKAMEAARENREETITLFLAHVDRLAAAEPKTAAEDDVQAGLFVFYLLGEWRDPRAYRPLTRLLRQNPDLLDRVIGDGLTEGASRVIAGVFDGDFQPIFDVIEDEAADDFARGAMIDALVIVACVDPQTRPQVAAYLEAFFDLDIAKPDVVWGAWAFAIADLGLVDLEPLARRAFEQEFVSPQEADFAFFQAQLRRTVETGAPEMLRLSRKTPLIEDAIDELSRWHAFSEAYLKRRSRAYDPLAYLTDTFEREGPKIGRNDPCPCGSGKKYKKCCLS